MDGLIVGSTSRGGRTRRSSGTAEARLGRRRRRRAALASGLVALALAAAGCGGVTKPPATTAVHQLTGASVHGAYVVTCTPPDGSIRLDQPQTWTVLVTTRTGAPADHLRLGFDIAMPQMSMAPAPAHSVTPEGHGRYLVRGVEFTMGGRWSITVTLDAPTRSDRARFSLQVG